jgi:hypothetical protein
VTSSLRQTGRASPRPATLQSAPGALKATGASCPHPPSWRYVLSEALSLVFEDMHTRRQYVYTPFLFWWLGTCSPFVLPPFPPLLP